MNRDGNHWNVLARDGDQITCRDINDLSAKLKLMSLPEGFPGRTEGRRSHHREAYCISNYLIALGGRSLLDFPFRLIKGERPDFILEAGGTRVGIEITEAGTERSQRAYTQLERSPAGTVLVGENHLQSSEKPLRMKGYAGLKTEEIATKLLLESIQRKTASIQLGDFRHADRYELLVWDYSHVNYLAMPGVVQEMLRGNILTWQSQSSGQLPYSKISIWRNTDSCLIYDVVSPASRLLYPLDLEK